MPERHLNKKNKLVLFASSMIVIPAINQLLQTGQLAGVVVPNRQEPGTQHLVQQLQQAGIPFQVYLNEQPDHILPVIDQWQADAGLTYTFHSLLPGSIRQAFRFGLYNLHASPLPRYRGAMPLYWQIRNGETQTSLTIIQTEDEADSGDIVLQQPLPIHDRDTLNTLANTMAAQAPGLILEFLEKLASDGLHPVPQEDEPTLAPMPKPEDLVVDWNTMTSTDISAMARAGNPQFNGAVVTCRQSHIALMQATSVAHPKYGVEPGTILHIGEPEGMIVATVDGALRLDIIMVTEGLFSGLAFAERFNLDAGMRFS
ncbi:methionyl-tRNA formyltransferase [Endozoicomonas sp. (ex Bugula neritina AB1)]|nr:methionyl-tRNA formyltransferase [Endozoicomonas sp. (ex Bugula neritina AB1)]